MRQLPSIAAVVLVVVLVLPETSMAVVGRRGDPPAPEEIGPAIEWRRIPFGARRKRQMAVYSERHYGERTWELTDPRVIVQHYTAGTSADSAWNHFAANSPHLGELPGVCAQFLVDTDGTIFQLVNLRVRCRHAIGMNWTAIGIEHVGTNARDVLRDPAMMRASLRLSSWLMLRYGIDVGNVIGHAEILRSPFHRERYPSWRCSTHADWDRGEMRIYRRRLKRVAERLGVPLGAGPRWVDSGC
ncbi:MAG TPA: peptidoglycan recognition family protein [Actinomycetota bacterium]|nr:peptidoglycan recognition family protein [Actinomycetota bacterium]